MKQLSFKKLLVTGLIIGLINSLTYSALAQTANLNLSQTPSVEVKDTYYDAKELSSSFVSWGINPMNPASINLAEAWKKFKKRIS